MGNSLENCFGYVQPRSPFGQYRKQRPTHRSNEDDENGGDPKVCVSVSSSTISTETLSEAISEVLGYKPAKVTGRQSKLSVNTVEVLKVSINDGRLSAKGPAPDCEGSVNVLWSL